MVSSSRAIARETRMKVGLVEEVESDVALK